MGSQGPAIDRLAASITSRLDWLDLEIQRQAALLKDDALGQREILDLFKRQSKTLRKQLSATVADSSGDEYKILQLEAYLTKLRGRISVFDVQFSRESRSVPPFLPYLIDRSARAWGVPPKRLMVNVGQPGNFVTRYEDYWKLVFDRRRGSTADVLSITLPIEGVRAASLPIVLGHEFVHYLEVRQPIGTDDILARLEAAAEAAEVSTGESSATESGSDGLTETLAIQGAAQDWLSEVVSDAYAIYRFGPAAYTSLIEFLSALGDVRAPSTSHPPVALRAQLMLQWLAANHSKIADEVVEPYKHVAEQEPKPGAWSPLYEALLSESDEIWKVVGAWAQESPYTSYADEVRIEELAELLLRGIPAAQQLSSDDAAVANEVEIGNAVWLATARGRARESIPPIDKLALKALDDYQFVESWMKAKGELAQHDSDRAPKSLSGVLASKELASRLNNVSVEQPIIITPLVKAAVGPSSIDLRLGNQFIVFERSANSAFDALQKTQDPRSMQTFIRKAWGDRFYLHPGELVLAATLEYVVMPGDLSAQVITRSSYGRLGLLSATAVQVHPAFHGCLTLELVNLGEMPLAITPGERIAQLMFFSLSDVYEADPAETRKYKYPTGPEFSKIRKDDESRTLRKMRTDFKKSSHH